MYGKRFKEALVKANIVAFCRDQARIYGGRSKFMERVDPNEVVKIFAKLGFDTKHKKKDDYYVRQHQIGNVEFTYNFILRYGVVEFVVSTRSNNPDLVGVDPIVRLLGDALGTDERMAPPGFANYAELEGILSDILDFIVAFQKFLTE